MVCGGLGNALGTGKETLLMKIGFWELIVIVIVAFVFIGPDQLPVYAKKIGKMLRELKKYTGAASEEIQKNVVEPLNEIQAPLKEAVAPLTDIKKDIDSSMRDVTKSFTGIGKTSKEEAAKKAEAERKAAAAARYHTIRQGDTLGALARKYRTSVKTLCRLNGIKETTTLRLGKKLRVK